MLQSVEEILKNAAILLGNYLKNPQNLRKNIKEIFEVYGENVHKET